MDIVFKLSVIILAGVIGGRLANRVNLPNVSGYIVAGLIIGPSFLNLVQSGDLDALAVVNDLALAAIAFTIGSEFLLSEMKRIGGKVLIVTFTEVLGAVLLVFMFMYYIFGQSFEFSLIVASMSAATAPAGIVMVIRELKADGPLVKTILPIVALDDALGIMVFGVSLSIVKMRLSGVSIPITTMIFNPLFEILGSLVIGFIIGVVMTYVCKKAKDKDELLILVIGFILLGTGVANITGVSPLLTCMVIGGTLINLVGSGTRVFSSINDFTPPIFLMFFTIAGASLNLTVLISVGAIGIGYIIARGLGKGLGATVGAKLVGFEDTVVKNLGMSLLTQGGVSIGLSMTVRKQLPQLSDSVVSVILFSVLIFEILGPILASIGIKRAGEVNGMLKGRECS